MLNYSDVKMGCEYRQWQEGKNITITLCVTEDCNLNCKYCYMVGKNNKHKMTFETAREIVDFVLGNEYLCQQEAIVWDFIGGEPLLEIEMIDKLCDYIVARMYALNHKWFEKYRFTFATNGVLYGEPAVQNFIDKHKGHVWFTLSIDGTREKHNLSRIKRDGTGSYDDVIRNVPLWLKQFPNASNKATFSHEDIPYLKDSIIHLWELGIKHVTANLVYEDVWQEGDDLIYERQLKELADYVLQNGLWNNYGVDFFKPVVGLPIDRECLLKNRCTAGTQSMAFDSEGNLYPCIRFLDMCLEDGKKYVVGNLKDGINHDYLRAFTALTWENQSDHECNTCQEGKECGWCVAYNYSMSPDSTLFSRSKTICKMHKANARANKYFWTKFEEITDRTSQRAIMKSMVPNAEYLKYIQFITADDITPHCGYLSSCRGGGKMPETVLRKGLEFCRENELIPVFIGDCRHGLDEEKKLFFSMLPVGNQCPENNTVTIYDNSAEDAGKGSKVAILLVNKNNIVNIHDFCQKLLESKIRINLFVQDLEIWADEDIDLYAGQMKKLGDMAILYADQGRSFNINVLSDFIDFDIPRDCGAGVMSVALAPNGKFYICPAFYFNDESDSIGSIEEGLKIEKERYLRRMSPTCSQCGNLNCARCLFLNKKLTREINVPSEKQCILAGIHKREAERIKQHITAERAEGRKGML